MSKRAILPIGEDGLARKKWSVTECRFLTENGLLEPGKYELIEGEVVSKSGQSRLHIITVTQIIAVLAAIFGIESVRIRAQVGIGEHDEFNDPDPDAAVLHGVAGDYLYREPDPSTEIRLIVEASDTSFVADTTTKANIYARHGLPEYWVVAIPTRELIVFRQPTAAGYIEKQTLSQTDRIAPLAAPDSFVQVAALMP